MRNVSTKLLNSYFALLNGSVSVPVYIDSVPDDEDGNYIELRVESESEVDLNDKSWLKEVIVIADIVTVFDTMVNPDIANGIDNEIGVLLCTTPFSGHNLTAQTGMQINRLQIDDATYLQEDDGTKKIYRKITRYNNLITIKI